MAAAVAALAGAAGAATVRSTYRIVPGVSIGGAKLNASIASTGHALGKVRSISRGLINCPMFPRGAVCPVYTYRSRPGLTVQFQGIPKGSGIGPSWQQGTPKHPVVSYLYTKSSRYRTSSGIAVGSTIKEVLAAYPSLVCPTNSPYDLCYLAKTRGGWLENETDFNTNGVPSPTSVVTSIDMQSWNCACNY